LNNSKEKYEEKKIDNKLDQIEIDMKVIVQVANDNIGIRRTIIV